MVLSRFPLLAVLAGLIACSDAPPSEAKPPPVHLIEDVSLVALIASPDKYDGRWVRVQGFTSIQFEGNAVYLHEDDYRFLITRNGLWLDVGDFLSTDHPCNLAYCLLEGRFDAGSRGHLGLWSGALTAISRAEVVLPRTAEPRRDPSPGA